MIELRKHKHIISAFIALIMLITAAFYSPIKSNAATTAPTITAPRMYGEVPTRHSYTFSWSAPSSGTVDHYLFSIRQIRSGETQTDITYADYIRRNVGKSLKITLPGSIFLTKCQFRVAVGAVFSNGSEKWDECIFYSSLHDMQTEWPASFKIWSGFSEASKNAIYYSTQAWNNAVAFEIVNTYPFSNSFPTNTINNNDGINSVVKVYDPNHPTAAMVTYVSNAYFSDREFDITVNPNKSWATSKQSGKLDVQSAMTHEMGHVVGLTDRYDTASSDLTMYWQIYPNDISMRSLSEEDKLNVRFLSTVIPW